MSVHVTSGVHSNSFDVAGQSVSQVRSALSGLMSIAADAVPYVDGAAVTGSHVLTDDSEVEFIKAAGTKGLPA